MRAAVVSVALALSFASMLVAPAARADATCITAYEQTQTLRKDGKPLASKAQAAICSRDTCPALLTKDCTKWLAELEALIPTVVLDPRTPAGAPRTDVRVKLDGALLDEKIDGKPVAVEPGPHTFVFEAEGGARAERAVVLKEGEKHKKVTVTLAPAASDASDANGSPSADGSGSGSGSGGVKSGARPVPIGVWIFGGASVVALATSAVFAIDGLGKKSDLDSCKPRCAASDVDAMSASFTLADVALGAGVMAGAAAVYLFLTRPSVESSGTASGMASKTATTRARVRAAPFATPLRGGGGAAGITAAF